jgi:hypothetical protein
METVSENSEHGNETYQNAEKKEADVRALIRIKESI